MKKVTKKKPRQLTGGIQTRLMTKVQVTYSPADRSQVISKYQIDANIIPPAGASGIPLATITVVEGNTPRNPVKDSQMVLNPVTGMYSASGLGLSPQSKARIWGEVTVTWMIPQTEKATSVIQTVP